MKPTLLVLAAGMGSRYGGLKQIDPFGPNGETILDYSLYDALNEGFGKVVFVIRKSFEDDFKDFFAGKFDDRVKIEYVYQEIGDVPPNIDYDHSRKKPWGTAHAVWVARDAINEPFVVINADDFYGRGAYRAIRKFFEDDQSTRYALVGYPLEKTLSLHGTVNRGVCQTDDSNHLVGIHETLKIGYHEDGMISYPDGEAYKYLAPETVVSMNFWGFYPDYFRFCEERFADFLSAHGHELKSEFFIPLLVEYLIRSEKKNVEVVTCDEEWFGVTYQEDKPFVQQRIRKLIEQGRYPQRLWG